MAARGWNNASEYAPAVPRGLLLWAAVAGVALLNGVQLLALIRGILSYF